MLPLGSAARETWSHARRRPAASLPHSDDTPGAEARGPPSGRLVG
jgi:hypothetical protein